MTFARVFWPVILLAAASACSGNIGGGQSTLPGAPPNGSNNVQQIAPLSATPTPSSASNVATLGDTVAPQVLPTIAGWGGTIAFPRPSPSPTPAPNPKASGSPPPAMTATPAPVSIGITSSTVEPSDAPHFSPAAAKHKHDPSALMPLLFVSLLATSDVTVNEYPRIALDVPRDIAAKYHNDTYALALYDPQAKTKAYALAVAERDLSSPAPGTLPTAAPTATPTAAPTTTPFGLMNGPPVFTPPPIGGGLGTSGLPPEYVAFKATPATINFKANQPVVFALYAIPPQPSPSPSPTAKPSASPSPSPTPSGSPSPQASVIPAAIPSVTPAVSPGASTRPADRP
jgi:hypothetical protein